MSRRPVTPWPELSGLQDRLRQLLEEALLGGRDLPGTGSSATTGWRPLVDLLETLDTYVLYAELPGVRRSDLALESDGRSLELAGQRRPPDRGFLRLEGSWGSFRRRLQLPGPVVPERIEARFRRGVLEVVLPKATAGEGAQVPVRGV